MSTQQDILQTVLKTGPICLTKRNYVPWSSRLLRYAKSRPNGKLIYKSIMNGPYVRRMIPEPVQNQGVQNIGNQNGQIGVQNIGNGNVVAARAEADLDEIGSHANLHFDGLFAASNRLGSLRLTMLQSLTQTDQ
ncbi:hypothetical protein Tco_0550879 [Tanacetum coccineum]